MNEGFTTIVLQIWATNKNNDIYGRDKTWQNHTMIIHTYNKLNVHKNLLERKEFRNNTSRSFSLMIKFLN